MTYLDEMREPRRITIPLPRFRALGCDAGGHLARGATDREGRRLFVCSRCPAWRYGDDPTWRTT